MKTVSVQTFSVCSVLYCISIHNELICSQMFSSNMLKQPLSPRLSFLSFFWQEDDQMALTINTMANRAL